MKGKKNCPCAWGITVTNEAKPTYSYCWLKTKSKTPWCWLCWHPIFDSPLKASEKWSVCITNGVVAFPVWMRMPFREKGSRKWDCSLMEVEWVTDMGLEWSDPWFYVYECLKPWNASIVKEGWLITEGGVVICHRLWTTVIWDGSCNQSWWRSLRIETIADRY